MSGPFVSSRGRFFSNSSQYRSSSSSRKKPQQQRPLLPKEGSSSSRNSNHGKGSNKSVGAQPLSYRGGAVETTTASSSVDHWQRNISARTGGFEGAVPLHYDECDCDDKTIQADNTVKSNPERAREQLKKFPAPLRSSSTNFTSKTTKKQSKKSRSLQFLKRWKPGSGDPSKRRPRSAPDMEPMAMMTTPVTKRTDASTTTPVLSPLSTASASSTSRGRIPFRKWRSSTTGTTATTTVESSQSPTSTSKVERLNSIPRFVLPDDDIMDEGQQQQQQREHSSLADLTDIAVKSLKSSTHCVSRLLHPSGSDDADDTETAKKNTVRPLSRLQRRHSVPASATLDQVPSSSDSNLYSTPILRDESLVHDTTDDVRDGYIDEGSTDEGFEMQYTGHRSKMDRADGRERSMKTEIRPLTEEGLKQHEQTTHSPSSTRRNQQGTDNSLMDFSVAPLGTMPELMDDDSHDANDSNDDKGGHIKKRGLGSLMPFRFAKKQLPVAHQILERERTAALEDRTKALFVAQHERGRIELNRQEYLDQQRSREQASAKALPRTMSTRERDSIFTELLGETESPPAVVARASVSPITTATTTSSSSTSRGGSATAGKSESATKVLPACVVCGVNERTHIGLPCMHLAYCGGCALQLERHEQPCFVCAMPNVKYSEVSV